MSAPLHYNHYTTKVSVLLWGWNWILFMHGWFCSIRLIHVIGWKSIHFEKKLNWFDHSANAGSILHMLPRSDSSQIHLQFKKVRHRVSHRQVNDEYNLKLPQPQTVLHSNRDWFRNRSTEHHSKKTSHKSICFLKWTFNCFRKVRFHGPFLFRQKMRNSEETGTRPRSFASKWFSWVMVLCLSAPWLCVFIKLREAVDPLAPPLPVGSVTRFASSSVCHLSMICNVQMCARRSGESPQVSYQKHNILENHFITSKARRPNTNIVVQFT